MTIIIIPDRKEFIHDLAVEIVMIMMDVEIAPLDNGYTRADTDNDTNTGYRYTGELTFTMSGD